MKKILIVNVNWLGDCIFSAPAFKALKTQFPGCHIACMAVPRVKEVLECIPDIDEIIIYDEDNAHKFPWAKWQLISDLKKKRFDMAFIFHRSLTRALLVYLAGIPERIGYDTKGRGPFLTHKYVSEENTMHRSDYYLKLLELYGIDVRDRKSSLNVKEEIINKANQILEQNGISKKDSFVALHLGGNWSLKRWPLENFSLLMKRLSDEFKFPLIITGGKDDFDLAQEAISDLKIKPVILAGKTTLKELMAVFKRAALVISADSGPLHLANSVGATVIGLFGPTRPEITGPRGAGILKILQHDVGCNRVPCYHLTCTNNVCMKSITVEEVCETVRQIKSA